ncbi:ABC-type phosphate transport system substrate-binding protein [Kribbella sp. VKM Ac-2527]|uniref:ABC-type phosphate transport system substrate-binding protein n=1 Tax=Kribbella caucasensis TaxID=2512215 RepID=A0A4R6JF91_9ACTN|nr:substrate-binding domain-containing protein [Kribbella sp. VKM Ac-2527]TDO33235.1 ABC-type phosphate transport system substrate-binding protein [Kribbella sp. VKM Ac-2527]
MSLAVDFSGLGDINLETVIAAVALIGTAIAWLVDRYFLRRKRLVYRVQVDAPIGVNSPMAQDDSPMVDVEFRHKGSVIEEPSVVLLRVDNAGGMDIEPHHMHDKVSFAFPDRKIVGLEVSEPKPESLGEMLRDRLESENFLDTSKVIIPRIAINRGDSFKFLLLLSGPGRGVTHSGYLAGGAAGGGVYHEPRPRGPGRRTLMFGALSLLLVGALVALFVVDVLQPPDNCASGQLRVIGSTAVEATVKEVRSAYAAECTESDITIAANGSRNGTRTLNETGKSDPAAAEKLIAMSDGSAEEAPDLQGKAIAVVVFAVVVNRSTDITGLTTNQLRDIYAGRLTNWKQLGGRELPIRMVSRVGPDSGSRRVFREKVLAGDQELGISSDDCKTKDNPVAKHHRCEVGTTEELLSRVNDIEGAIGYAELGTSRKFPGLTPITIDTVVPDAEKVADHTYRFWEVERAYTYKAPKPESLQAAFLEYLGSAQAKPILARDGLVPCSDLPGSFCG